MFHKNNRYIYMQRLKGLDGVRGILAVCVALSHSYSHFTGWGTGYNFFRNSTYAVDIFFILSGIVLYYNYKDKIQQNKVHAITFLITRVFRLFPIYLFSLAMIPICLYVSNGQFFPDWVGTPSLTRVLPDLFLTNNIFGMTPFLNPPSWSISSELFIGSIVVILCCFDFRLSILVILLSILSMHYLGIKPNDINKSFLGFISGGMARCAFGVSMGVLSIEIIQKLTSKLKLQSKLIFFIMSLSASMTIIIMVGVYLDLTEYIIITTFIALSIAALPFSENIILRAMESDVLKFLGDRSFSIYLMHTPVIYAFLAFKSNDINYNIAFATIAVLSTVYLSKFTLMYIEKPFITMARNIFKK